MKLSEIIDLFGGGTPKTSVEEYWDGDIYWLSVKDFNNDKRYVYDTEKKITEMGLNNSSTKLLKKDDIIISARGTVGELAMIPYPMAFNQSCYGIRAKENIVDSTYLYYLLKIKISELRSAGHGSVFNTITRDTFSSIDVELPDLATQRKVASILSVIDDKIELNSKLNANLMEMAEAVFQSWFVNFDNFGDEDLEECEIGIKPKNWSVGNLVDIAEYLNGLAMQKFRPLDNEIGIPVLKIKELRQGNTDKSSELCSPNIKPEYVVQNGDVIFSWSGSLLVDFWCGNKCGLNQHLFKVTSKKYDKWFYFAWTNYHLQRFIAIAADKATTMGHIKRDDLKNSYVLIPSNEDYKIISDIIKPLYDAIIHNRLENSNLTELRDSLLPKLMAGEI